MYMWCTWCSQQVSTTTTFPSNSSQSILKSHSASDSLEQMLQLIRAFPTKAHNGRLSEILLELSICGLRSLAPQVRRLPRLHEADERRAEAPSEP